MTSSKTFWQTSLVLTFVFTLTALGFSIARWAEIGVILSRSVWGLALLIYLAALAACIFLFFWIQKNSAAEKTLAALDLTGLQGFPWRLLAGSVFAAILLLIPWLKFTYHIGEVVKKSTQDPVLSLILFYLAVWALIGLASAALKVALRVSWPVGFAAALIGLGIAYEIYQRSQAVTVYPFSLGWSEGSRYFYASLYYSKALYGQTFALSSLHPSRYLLQSLPFLLPTLGLEAHRFWQFALWLGMNAAAAWALVQRREALNANGLQERGTLQFGRWGTALLAGWLFLFFLRVGVYYHLMPMLILPALFVSPRHPWRSLLVVIFASLWAGISRVNWFPVPAALAIALYLLETPLEKTPLTRYFRWPLAWGVSGLLAALAAQAAYIPLSGNAQNVQAFASSFSSDLLWDRLWPNELFPLGIVPAILLLSAPLLLTLALNARQLRLHPLRWAGLLGLLAIFFAGSLVVSVKIGGGGDLHNMDAFATLLGLVSAWLIGGKVAAESALRQTEIKLSWPVTAFALILPLGLLLPTLSPRPTFNLSWAQQNLLQLRQAVENAPGPVLFINERQLLTFGLVQAPMMPEYEAVTLMEMAMSNNTPYLEQFYADLRAHRFARIVAGKQNLGLKDEGAFAEENNVWNTRIAPYLLCYYEPIVTLEPGQGKIQVFAPRAQAGAVCP